MPVTVGPQEKVESKTSASSSDHSPSRELARLESGAHKLTTLTGSMLQEGISEITTVGSHLLLWAGVAASSVLAVTGVVVYSFLTLTGELANYGAERWALSPTERALVFVGLNGIGVLGVMLSLLAVHAFGKRGARAPLDNNSATSALQGADLSSTRSETASRSEPPSRVDVVVAKMNLTITRLARAFKNGVNPINWVRSAPGVAVIVGVGIALFMLRDKKRQLPAAATEPSPKTGLTTEQPTALLSIAILLFWKEIAGPLFINTLRGIGGAALEEFLKGAPAKGSLGAAVSKREVPPVSSPFSRNESIQSLQEGEDQGRVAP